MATFYVVEQGAEIRCDGERLEVRRDDQTLGSAPLVKIEDLVIFGNVGISTPAIKQLLDRGIEVTFLTVHGRYHGRLIGQTTAHVALRRAQYRRADDPVWALRQAQACVNGKLRNCRAVLQRFARNRAVVDEGVLAAADAQDHYLDRIPRTTTIAGLMGLEGSATARYFGGIRALLGPMWHFHERNRRPPITTLSVTTSQRIRIVLVAPIRQFLPSMYPCSRTGY